MKEICGHIRPAACENKKEGRQKIMKNQEIRNLFFGMKGRKAAPRQEEQASRLPVEKQEPNRENTGKNGVIDHIQAKKMVGDVLIPAAMAEIPDRLFDGNKKITGVTIPGTVKCVGSRAFADCENLKRVVLGEGIEEIGSNVFTGCGKLRKVVYPDSVTRYQGWTFYGTKLEAPVLNASGTILVFCPSSVSGREWSVPDTVKTIAWQAFIENQELEVLRLPEGLERIERMAFIECGMRKITIPYSVREIGAEAFYRCERLEKAVILNPKTKIGAGAFSGCGNLKEIVYAKLSESDRIFHLKGQPFLIQHLEDPANLNHREDPEFARLTAGCANGDADAMYALAEWFGRWARMPGASSFYIRAANYWRYRSYRKGNEKAVKWFQRFFAEHPGEQLESILFESSDHRAEYYSYSIPGKMLNDLGFAFFSPGRNYEIKQFEGEDLVTASAFESHEPPDEDGFGAEDNYDWWFLDENMQPIPGVESVNATMRETDWSFFTDVRDRAVKILRQRREGD